MPESNLIFKVVFYQWFSVFLLGFLLEVFNHACAVLVQVYRLMYKKSADVI
jgi:hypothetical protein